MPFTNLAPLTPPLRYTTSRFVIMETTNGVYNRSLYEAITPSSALMWQRVQVRGGGGVPGVISTSPNIDSFCFHAAPPSPLLPSCEQVANLGAGSGEEWVRLFEQHNSGTYNNQWMILDVKRLLLHLNRGSVDDDVPHTFPPVNDAPHTSSGLLWVLEQLPGTTESADVSSVLLEQGYWASYNVP